MWGDFGIRGGGTSTVYCLQRNTRTTRARGCGELAPSKLSTILSTLSTMQCSLLCSGRTTSSICIAVFATQSAIQQSLQSTVLESLLTISYFFTTSLLSLSHCHFHFLVTITFSLLLVSSPHLLYLSLFGFVVQLFRFFQTFRHVSVVLATLHFEKSLESCDFSGKHLKVTIVSKSYASCLEMVVFEGRSLPTKSENLCKQ